MLRRISFSLAAASLLAAAPASAQIFYALDNSTITQNGVAGPNSVAKRNEFLSNLSGTVQTETFEGLAVGTGNPALSFVGSGPTINAALSGNGTVQSACSSGSCPINYGFADGSPRFFFLSTGTGNEFNIKFNQAVAAFGFDGSDISDSGSSFFIQFLLGGVALTGFNSPLNVTNSGSLASSNQLFFGYINTGGFDEVRVSSNGTGDFFGFDNLTVGDAQQVVSSTVPEPSTYALMAAGLAGLLVVSRRRRVA